MHYDAIVIGLGGMGSATAATLARRGQRVLGLDRDDPPHTLGSTHGKSRIIRRAYMEDPAYVPLLIRAYELWEEVAGRSDDALLHTTGGLMIGTEDSDAVRGSVASAQQYDLPHELLSADEVGRRFPEFRLPADHVALHETVAGVLVPEACIRTYLRIARNAGAELRTGVTVAQWEAGTTGVTVHTDAGAFTADRLAITAGPWLGELWPALSEHLVVMRQVMHWFQPVEGVDGFLPDRFPVYIWQPPEGDIFYGFPALDGPAGGVKVAIHYGGAESDPATVDREVRATDVDRMRQSIDRPLPHLGGEWLDGAVCLYTNTPDRHFLLGHHPDHDNVAVAGGLSGHGFKFASVVGEVLTDLLLKGGTPMPIDVFSPARVL